MSCFLILLIIESKKMAMLSIPYIRFNKFDNEWFSKKLDLVSNVTMGQSPDSKNYTDNPNDYILVQGNADMQNGRVVPRVWTTQVTKLAEKGDLILSVRAPVGDVGKTDYNVVLGRGVAAIRGNDFLFYLLSRMKQTNYWAKFSTGSTFESINSSDIKSAEICLPSQEEQSAIGSLFRTLDELLASYKDNLTNYQSLKATMLTKMFPKAGQTVPEIRLDGFEGEWEVVNLGTLIENYDEVISGTSGFPIATSSRKGLYLQNDYFEGGRTGIDLTLDFHRVPIDYVTYRHMSDDSIFKFNKNNFKTDVLVSKEYPVFINNDNSDIDFLLYHLNNSRLFLRFSTMQKLGGTRVRLYYKNLITYKLAVPTLKEQQAIGSYFSNLDNLINSHQEKISQLETLKKKLLQDMFI